MTSFMPIAQLLTSPDAWAALVSLAALEIVLGIDNVIFISILVSRLDARRSRNARRLGMLLAVIFRIVLLFALTSLLGLSATVFTVWDNPFSWRELILIAGGLFLIAKATHELHAIADAAPDGDETADPAAAPPAAASMALVAGQIVVIDLVFSIDSIVTAIGMAQDVRIMIAAVLIAVAVMYAASGAVAGFVAAWPTTKTLALAFLLLIGVALVADGFDFHIPRGYVYFAMAFAAAVETFNILTARRRRRREPLPGRPHSRRNTASAPAEIAAGPLPGPPAKSPDQVPGQEGEG
jgi:predicted tellurium resistance membrane protein TerC